LENSALSAKSALSDSSENAANTMKSQKEFITLYAEKEKN